MLVKFETTTEIAACVSHGLIAKVIRNPSVDRFELSYKSTKNLKEFHSELKIVLPLQKKEKNKLRVYKLFWHQSCQLRFEVRNFKEFHSELKIILFCLHKEKKGKERIGKTV